jgi:uncharacterized membrane protein YhaH (DUF805 family)
MPRSVAMDSLAVVFSPSGRLAPKPFAIGVVAVYALMFLSPMLLSSPLSARGGIVPYAVAQAVLTWAWYVLHAKRLRDAGRGTGWALAIAILYALSVVLFLLVALGLYDVSAKAGGTIQEQSGALGPLVIFLFFVAMFTGDPGMSVLFYSALAVAVVVYLPFLAALVLSIVAGTRPSIPTDVPP